jgi:pyrroline-5-carboxylate reductase
MFSSSGSYTMIEESDMNRMIGVTSSSPAYVFLFANAIYQGALAQGLPKEGLMDAICDMIIGSAILLKQSGDLPSDLIAKVASKGGTTEQALRVLNDSDFTQIVTNAMIACTKRADELGKKD